MSKYTYILDPGHGGVNPSGVYVTPGKRSPQWVDGSIYYEGAGNRQIAELVAAKLSHLGIQYAFTVLPKNWMDISLSDRCRIANNIHRETPAILISIHSNAADSESANGYEVFTSPGKTKSDEYAKIWLEEMQKAFPNLNNRGVKEERFTVLTNSNCPAILIESMFHTNEVECRILMSDEGKCRIADVIVSTIRRIEQL